MTRTIPGTTKVATVWHERYHCPEAGWLPSTMKQKKVVDRARELGLVSLQCDGSFHAAKTWSCIRRVHDERYVEAVRTGSPRPLAQSQGLRWRRELAESVIRIWSGHIEACRLALREGRVLHPVSGAHHAHRRIGGGFCTFNYLVGAPRVLFEEGKVARVLIVDLDTHQGNGTWELAKDDERFALFDVSGSEFGVPEVETDRWFYRMAASEKDYFQFLSRLPWYIKTFRPDLIQYQAGMDCHVDDPLGGIPGMTAKRLWERDRFVFEAAASRGVPLVFNLAGGYRGEATIALHLGTVRESIAAQAGGSATDGAARPSHSGQAE